MSEMPAFSKPATEGHDPALAALREADFNWVRDLSSVWRNSPFHNDAIHKPVLDELITSFVVGTRTLNDTPIGRVVLGAPGTGKTHLLGELRKKVWRAGGWFVLLDIVGITDFWQTAALGFLNSLQQEMPDSSLQYEAVLKGTVRELSEGHKIDVETLRQRLHRRFPAQAMRFSDVLLALLHLKSGDPDRVGLAYAWTQGLDSDPERRKQLNLGPPLPSVELVRGLSWLMSVAGPTIIAVDQIDPIISASNLLAGVGDSTEDDSERKARAIIDQLAGGLMELRDVANRSMTVIACLPASWDIIKHRAVASAPQRFSELPALPQLTDQNVIARLIGDRLAPAYATHGFKPQYLHWPFRPEAVASAVGLLPRQVLMRCDGHRRRCVANGRIEECRALGEALPPPPPLPEGLDAQFSALLAGAKLDELLGAAKDDKRLRALLGDALALYGRELSPPDSIDVSVEPESVGKLPPLHGRFKFIHRADGDREQHWCFRVLEHPNPIAFQARLKAAITASGIDTKLKFRHLFVLRRTALPTGKKTQELIEFSKPPGGSFSRSTTRISAPSSRCPRSRTRIRTDSTRGCNNASRLATRSSSKSSGSRRRHSADRARRRRHRKRADKAAPRNNPNLVHAEAAKARAKNRHLLSNPQRLLRHRRRQRKLGARLAAMLLKARLNQTSPSRSDVGTSAVSSARP